MSATTSGTTSAHGLGQGCSTRSTPHSEPSETPTSPCACSDAGFHASGVDAAASVKQPIRRRRHWGSDKHLKVALPARSASREAGPPDVMAERPRKRLHGSSDLSTGASQTRAWVASSTAAQSCLAEPDTITESLRENEQMHDDDDDDGDNLDQMKREPSCAAASEYEARDDVSNVDGVIQRRASDPAWRGGFVPAVPLCYTAQQQTSQPRHGHLQPLSSARRDIPEGCCLYATHPRPQGDIPFAVTERDRRPQEASRTTMSRPAARCDGLSFARDIGSYRYSSELPRYSHRLPLSNPSSTSFAPAVTDHRLNSLTNVSSGVGAPRLPPLRGNGGYRSSQFR